MAESGKGRTPTALPRKNREMQSHGNVPANELDRPKTEVKNKVALNAVLRPMRSEPGRGSEGISIDRAHTIR